MSASTSQPPTEKETNLTFQCPLLTSTNYTIWRMRMEVLLGIHGVWDVVDPGLADDKKNNIVKCLLFQSIPEDLVLQIGNLKIGKEMWEAIKTSNLGADRVKEARLQTLVTEFENMKMLDNGSIDAYAVKLSGTASKLATLGEVMSEHKLVKKFLTSLPRRSNDSNGGRGRGSYYRGCGRGQGCFRRNNQNQGQHDSSKNREDNKHKGKKEEQHDLSHIECYRCISRVRFGDGFVCKHKRKGLDFVQRQATISGYDISIRGDFLTMRYSCGSLLIKVPRSANRLYKSQLKVGKEDTNQSGNEPDEEDESDSDVTPILVRRSTRFIDFDEVFTLVACIKTIRLLIALATKKGWKIHHLDVKTTFLHGD
ncbi:uncharacterized mitochondrial protein-like protein [Tanacetum coccineum]